MEVEKYLNQFRAKENDIITHISMGDNFKGKFTLDAKQNKKFNKLYANAINDGFTFSIGEKPKEYGPILIDVDLESNIECDDRLYNNKMIFEVIDTYREMANKYLNLEPNDVAVSLFEKPKPTIKKNNIIKDGFHLIFQDIICHYKLRYLIRDKVVKKLTGSPTFSGYNVDKVIDKAVVHTNCWLLPGSKKPDGYLYELTKIYDENNELLNLTNVLSNKYKMIKIYSLQYKVNCQEYEAEINKNINVDKEFLELGGKPTNNKKELVNNNNNNNKASIILDYLYDYDDYEIWSKVGMILKNELNNDDGLTLYLEWSQQSSKFDLNECIKFYNGYKKDGSLKFGTLIMMAKECNDENTYNEMITKINELDSNKTEYDIIKKDFEKKNFKLLNPISFITITDDQLIITNKTDFLTTYENLLYDTNKSFVKSWLKDANNKTYDRIDFLPMQQAPPNVYNTFKGYAAENKELFNIDITTTCIYKHIGNLCNNDPLVIDYFIKTLARKLQQPYNLTNTSLIFKSVEGCGKDLFFNWFGNKILGKNYYLSTEKCDLLFGKFNPLLENKILITINETSGKSTFSINENIKAAITAETNIIEHKGMNQYKNTNHIEYIFLTNNDNPLHIPLNDRRFCGIECNNDIAKKKEYFDPLRSEMNSGKVDKLFYNYLMSIDVDDYDFTNNRPITSYYNDIKELNKPTLISFIEHFIQNTSKETIEIQSTQLFTKFNEFVSNYNFKTNISLTKFMMDIKKINGIDQKRTKKYNCVVIDINEIKTYLQKNYNVEFNDNFIDSDDEESDNEKL